MRGHFLRASYDADSLTHSLAVQAADATPLESNVHRINNTFVTYTKADNAWGAIKASCILAGARTLAGGLVPLKGAAPTNFNFGSGDYDRKTGLGGDGTTKYLGSNRNNDADPQDNNHNAAWVSTSGTAGVVIGASATGGNGGSNNISYVGSTMVFRNRSNGADTVSGTAVQFVGASRATSASYSYRLNGVGATLTRVSQAPSADTGGVFTTNAAGSFKTGARIAFYSIGESLTLTLLDARLTTLMNAYAAAIP